MNGKDYPFLASAINITTMLLIHLHIYTQYTFCPCCGTSFKNSKKIPLKEVASFAFLLEESSWQTIFNELFCVGVRNYWIRFYIIGNVDGSYLS